MSDLKFKG